MKIGFILKEVPDERKIAYKKTNLYFNKKKKKFLKARLKWVIQGVKKKNRRIWQTVRIYFPKLLNLVWNSTRDQVGEIGRCFFHNKDIVPAACAFRSWKIWVVFKFFVECSEYWPETVQELRCNFVIRNYSGREVNGKR